MVSIRQVDLADASSFVEFYDVYARSHTREFDSPWIAVEKKFNLTDDAYGTSIALVARDDAGTAVAGGTAMMPLLDNLDFVFVEVFTVPDQRRRGFGTSILKALIEAGRSHGRRTAFGEPLWGIDETDDPGRPFAGANGFELDMLDAVRELSLPAAVPPLVLDPGYTLQTWRGPCPHDIIEQYADLRRLLVDEAPSGGAGLENEYWDAERVRQDEAKLRRMGRRMQVTVARSGDGGGLVGHTQLCFPGGADEVFQWDTLVRSEHRGHGLGLALKIHTMHAAADLLDGRRRITTENAASNSHMIAVNELLGFRQTAWTGEYIRTI